MFASIDHFCHSKPSTRRDISNLRPFQSLRTHSSTRCGRDVACFARMGCGSMRASERCEVRYLWSQSVCDGSSELPCKNIGSLMGIAWVLSAAPLMRVQRTKHRSKSPISMHPVFVGWWQRRNEKSVQDSSNGSIEYLLNVPKWK